MMIGMHHVALSVPDIEKATDFYTQAFGFEVVSSGGWEKGFTGADRVVGLKDSVANAAMLKGKNAYLELFEYIEPTPHTKDPDYPVNHHGYTHFCMQVTDIKDEYERLKSLGMRFHCPPEELGTTAATYGRDPFGNVIEIYEIFDDETAQLPPKS